MWRRDGYHMRHLYLRLAGARMLVGSGCCQRFLRFIVWKPSCCQRIPPNSVSKRIHGRGLCWMEGGYMFMVVDLFVVKQRLRGEPLLWSWTLLDGWGRHQQQQQQQQQQTTTNNNKQQQTTNNKQQGGTEWVPNHRQIEFDESVRHQLQTSQVSTPRHEKSKGSHSLHTQHIKTHLLLM